MKTRLQSFSTVSSLLLITQRLINAYAKNKSSSNEWDIHGISQEDVK